MSSPKREEKIYGAVTTEDHITFTGFCKKIYSEEKFDIDVYIDEEKVDIIKADKTIENELNIYDTDGFCFEYTIPEEIIEKKSKIEFKCEHNNLLNSPLEVSNEDNLFKEFYFMEKISNINYKEIEKNYKPNTLGIIINSNSLQNIALIKYIKDISKRFDKLTINLFYFNQNEKNLIDDLFNIKNSNMYTLLVKSIFDIINNTEIFIHTDSKNNNFYYKMLSNSKNIIFFDNRIKGEKIVDIDKLAKKNQIFINPKQFNLTNEILTSYKLSYTKLMFERIMHNLGYNSYNINLNENANSFYNFERIRLVLDIPGFKSKFIDEIQSKYIYD